MSCDNCENSIHQKHNTPFVYAYHGQRAADPFTSAEKTALHWVNTDISQMMKFSATLEKYNSEHLMYFYKKKKIKIYVELWGHSG